VEGDLRKHLYPALGGRPLNSITRSDVQAWETQLSQQLAHATVAVVYSFRVASDTTILKSAVADGIIAATPCHEISLPRIPVAHVEPLSADQVQAIAASMPPRHRALVLVRKVLAWALEVSKRERLEAAWLDYGQIRDREAPSRRQAESSRKRRLQTNMAAIMRTKEMRLAVT
jgi:hypothetical protein